MRPVMRSRRRAMLALGAAYVLAAAAACADTLTTQSRTFQPPSRTAITERPDVKTFVFHDYRGNTYVLRAEPGSKRAAQLAKMSKTDAKLRALARVLRPIILAHLGVDLDSLPAAYLSGHVSTLRAEPGNGLAVRLRKTLQSDPRLRAVAQIVRPVIMANLGVDLDILSAVYSNTRSLLMCAYDDETETWTGCDDLGESGGEPCQEAFSRYTEAWGAYNAAHDRWLGEIAFWQVWCVPAPTDSLELRGCFNELNYIESILQPRMDAAADAMNSALWWMNTICG